MIRQKFEPELLLPAESYLRSAIVNLTGDNVLSADVGSTYTTAGTLTTAGRPTSTPATSTTPISRG